MIMADDNRSLSSAILSLLVAADQRCPAIIGQAHLLYHARSNEQPDDAAKTLAQLKRDVDDLSRAVANVEVAMNRAGSDPASLSCLSDQSDLRRQLGHIVHVLWTRHGSSALLTAAAARPSNSLDSCNENLPKETICRKYGSTSASIPPTSLGRVNLGWWSNWMCRPFASQAQSGSMHPWYYPQSSQRLSNHLPNGHRCPLGR